MLPIFAVDIVSCVICVIACNEFVVDTREI